MLKKTITYKDIDGNVLVEDFYFNLSIAELTRMDLVEDNKLGEILQQKIVGGKGKDIIETFEWVLEQAYGVRSEDGKYFEKSPELFRRFKNSDAYTDLFMTLVTDANAAAQFINAILPQEMEKQLEEYKAKISRNENEPSGFVTPEIPSEPIKEYPKDPKDMSREELLKAFQEKNK